MAVPTLLGSVVHANGVTRVRFTDKKALTGALVAVSLGAGVLTVGCGGDDAQRPRGTPVADGRATPSPPSRSGRGPVPDALRTVESAAEDTIDFALAGRRQKVVETADALKAAADGPAAEALRAAGVSAARIAEFRARADEVARLAPKARLLRVAFASNRAFAMVPGFFALYENRVPADVLELDYLDFEAKLQARARDGAALRSAVERLDRTWGKLRPGLIKAGGKLAAAKFDAHIESMQRLATRGDPARAAKEAQHGLDLVDEVENVYSG
jgi:hypothetical protein